MMKNEGQKQAPAPFTSAKEVMLSSDLVCLFVGKQDYAKTAQTIFIKVGRKLARWPGKCTFKVRL